MFGARATPSLPPHPFFLAKPPPPLRVGLRDQRVVVHVVAVGGVQADQSQPTGECAEVDVEDEPRRPGRPRQLLWPGDRGDVGVIAVGRPVRRADRAAPPPPPRRENPARLGGKMKHDPPVHLSSMPTSQDGTCGRTSAPSSRTWSVSWMSKMWKYSVSTPAAASSAIRSTTSGGVPHAAASRNAGERI